MVPLALLVCSGAELMCRAEGGGGGGEEEITIAKNRTNMFPHVAFVYHALLLPMAPRVQHESQKDWPIVPSSSPVLSDTEAEAAFSNDGKWSWVFVGSHLELFKANSIHTTGRTVRIGALCVRHMGEEQTITSVVEIPPGKGSACGRSAPLLAISVEQSTYFLFFRLLLLLLLLPRSFFSSRAHPFSFFSSSRY